MKSLKVERKFVSWFCYVCLRWYDQLAHDNIEKNLMSKQRINMYIQILELS